MASEPESDDGIIPYIIPGANNGGNRTCEEVAAEFNTTFDLCGDKVDYGNIDMPGAFPHGLEVTVTMGKYVAFTMDDCVKIGDYYYKVGAVIVKGSSAANVYFYPGGTLGDSGLAAPINSSGTPAGLSNLTFCFVKCERPALVVGFKSYMTLANSETYNGIYVTSGAFITSYPLVLGGSYLLYQDGELADANKVGHLTVTDNDHDGKYEVTVDNYLKPSVYFLSPFLYIGTQEGFVGLDYTLYPYPDPKYNLPQNSATWTFEMP